MQQVQRQSEIYLVQTNFIIHSANCQQVSLVVEVCRPDSPLSLNGPEFIRTHGPLSSRVVELVRRSNINIPFLIVSIQTQVVVTVVISNIRKSVEVKFEYPCRAI